MNAKTLVFRIGSTVLRRLNLIKSLCGAIGGREPISAAQNISCQHRFPIGDPNLSEHISLNQVKRAQRSGRCCEVELHLVVRDNWCRHHNSRRSSYGRQPFERSPRQRELGK